jgi:hypothetical protein
MRGVSAAPRHPPTRPDTLGHQQPDNALGRFHRAVRWSGHRRPDLSASRAPR